MLINGIVLGFVKKKRKKKEKKKKKNEKHNLHELGINFQRW